VCGAYRRGHACKLIGQNQQQCGELGLKAVPCSPACTQSDWAHRTMA
jgi:hypothetical protein